MDKTWELRIMEISQKYSLTPDQTQALKDEVLYVIVGLTLEENFTGAVISALSISQLIAEELITELNTRVFQYAENVIESEDVKIPPIKLTPDFSNPTLELPPNDLPMVEGGETAHDVARSDTVQSQPEATATASGISVPRYIPPTSEPVRVSETSGPVSATDASPKPTLSSEIAEQMSVMDAASATPHVHESLADVALMRSPVRDAQPHPTQPSTQSSAPSSASSQFSSSQPGQKSASAQERSAPDNLPGIEIIPDKKYPTDPYREPLE